ncbi:hypothetical protein ACOCEA_09520 [Maribacter sp. CXY002]|uniref:hypothetical protein n=1 Tax=Maribacter luteocoastalis TaxID=3407671 RepID=UPI003B67ACF9
MRNLEFSLYVILIIYLYKTIDSLIILLSYGNYEEYLIPSTFIPLGVSIFLLYLVLMGLTLLSFSYRKQLVGSYRFDEMGQHVDNWN